MFLKNNRKTSRNILLSHQLIGVQKKFTHLPEWIPLLREDLEVSFSKLNRRQCLEPQVSPALDKLHQRLKGVQTQTIITIVGEVGHEDADLDLEGNIWKTIFRRRNLQVSLHLHAVIITSQACVMGQAVGIK